MTDPTETARQLLWRHQLPEDVIDGALALHAQELAAKIRSTDLPDWFGSLDSFENGVGWAADLINPAVSDGLAGTANAEQYRGAVSAGVAAATDQAAPVCKFDEGCHRVVACDPGCGAPLAATDRAALVELGAQAIWAQYADAEPSRNGLVMANPHAAAAAVLAMLPAPAEEHRLALSEALGLGTGAPWDAIHDRATELGLPPLDRDPVAQRLGLVAEHRAAVLREAADVLWNHPRASATDSDFRGASDVLRRVAAESAPATGHDDSETLPDGEPTESVIYEVVGDWGVDSADSAEGARAAVAKWLREYPKCGAYAQQRIVRDWPDGSEFYGPWTDLPEQAAAAQQPKEA